MRLLMSQIEDGAVSGAGLSLAETVFTFLVIPVALFTVIALLSWLASAPRKKNRNLQFPQLINYLAPQPSKHGLFHPVIP